MTFTSFNPRARVGRDECQQCAASTHGSFNPRARVGRDAQAPATAGGLSSFNPRARVGRDSAAPSGGPHDVPFQSTRPRGARPQSLFLLHCLVLVSIHAPAWGATSTHRKWHGRSHVSIHAPAWGATPRSVVVLRRLVVSIHAPAWGATRHSRPQPVCARVSIHAPAWGATAMHRNACGFEWVSIHAPAWGATVLLRVQVHSSEVSIHAPAWGATPGAAGRCGWCPGFNPRARVGRDKSRPCNTCTPSMFQSTRPRGARQGVWVNDQLRRLFQSTRPRGARRAWKSIASPWSSFNPRARVGRDGGLGVHGRFP